MYTAVIAFPSQIWCVGAQALLSSCGWDILSIHTTLSRALDAMACRSVDLMVIAKGLLAETGEGGLTALTSVHSGKIAVVLEDGAALSSGDFVDWNVEGLILGSASEIAFRECFADLRRDRCWIDPDIRKVLGKGRGNSSGPLLGSLSGREQEVAQLAAEGLSNKQIARAMEVSDGTIKMHMHHVLTKLHITSRMELVRLTEAAEVKPNAAPGRPALRLIGG